MRHFDNSLLGLDYTPMLSVADIFSALGGPSAVARVLHVRTSTASEMKRRGSIPAEYWRELIVASQRQGITGVTADTLAALHARSSAGKDNAPSTMRPSEDGQGRPAGHFSRFYHVSKPHFASREAIRDHVSALRDEWERR